MNTRSMATRWLALPLILALATACGSGGGRSVSTGDAGSEKQALARGTVTVKQSPLSARSQPLILAMGSDVLVFGGHVVDGSNRLSLDDAALYLGSEDRWERIGNAPFSAAPYQASAVWTGSEAILVGMPCPKSSPDIEVATCEAAPTQVVAYSPSGKAWRIVSDELEPVDKGALAPFSSSGVGVTKGSAVFHGDAGPHEGQLLIVPQHGGAPHWIAGYPGADATCSNAGAVVAIHTGQADTGSARLVPNPDANAKALEVYSLDPTTGTWSLLSKSEKPDSADDDVQQIVCSAGTVAYFGFRLLRAKTVLWLSDGNDGWSGLPPIEFTNYPSNLATAATSTGRVVWATTLGELLTLSDAGSWQAQETETLGPIALQQFGKQTLVDASYDMRDTVPFIAYF